MMMTQPKFFVFMVLLFLGAAANSFAESCQDVQSQEQAGLILVNAMAKAALPGVEGLMVEVSRLKEHHLNRVQRFWNPEQTDYLSFDVILGKPSAGAIGGYSPGVAYTVTVDQRCKATAQLDFQL